MAKNYNVKAVAGFTALLALMPAVVTAAPTAVAPGESGGVMEVATPSSGMKFTLGLGGGYVTGQSKEYVYVPEYNNHKLSELKWDINSMYMLGVNSALEIGSRFVLKFDGWFQATDGDGDMDDYDWYYIGYDYSHVSQSPNTDVTDGSMIDINAGYNFLRSQNAVLTGIIGYKRDNFGWTATGGTYSYYYGYYTGTLPDDEPGVSYEQTMETVYAGIGFSASFSGNFRMAGRVVYSPFAQAETTDHHHLRNMVIYDDFEEGDFWGLDIAGAYDFNKTIAFELGLRYQSYDNMQGDAEYHWNDTGEVGTYDDYSGMDHSSVMITAMAHFKF